jgi:hypothetical protein
MGLKMAKQIADKALVTKVKSKKVIPINIARFWEGATCEHIVNLVLSDLHASYDFQTSDSPSIVLYGPYGGQMPQGTYVKVFIGCENVRPIMSECNWAFGMHNEDTVNDLRYMKIMRWGDDENLVQRPKQWAAILKSKKKFCAFVYSNPVRYREQFYRALSQYKQVDSPGQSMKNMSAIDSGPSESNWRSKIDFLRSYKFVVAFENSSYSGYHTEKITHPIEADSIPIYWGDPHIGRYYNTRRFVNAHDFLPNPTSFLPRMRYLPHSLNSASAPHLFNRIARRFNQTGSELEQLLWAKRGFDRLIDEIIRLDNDDELYLEYLKEPFLIDNKRPDRSLWVRRWQAILEGI